MPATRRVTVLLLVAAVLVPGACGLGRSASPQFHLSSKDLRAIIAPLPEGPRTAILAKPDVFLQMVAEVLDQPADWFLLVDKSHPLPREWAPADLVGLRDRGIAGDRAGLQVRAEVASALKAMTAAAAADGAPLVVGSAYRSWAYQAEVYAREVEAYGREQADRESARPGMSQHQLGAAVDFSPIGDAFTGSAQDRWLRAHAAAYGFSLSYPDGLEALTGYRHESWHWRYLTPAGVRLQDAFFGGVQQDLLAWLAASRAALEKARVRR